MNGVQITVDIKVDPAALATASAAVARQAETLGLVRRHLADVEASLGAWAVDGELAGAAPRCLSTVRWKGDRLAAELTALSERLRTAGAD
jgi:hypothetical protein